MNENEVKSTASTITKSKITTPKILMLICAVLSILIDVIVIVMLSISTSELIYFIAPIALLILDIAYIVKVIFSSYRFAYAIHGVIVHSVCVVLFSALAIIMTGALDGRVVFQALALYAMPIVHIVQCAVALYLAISASYSKNIATRVIKIAVAAIFAVSVIIYGNQLLSTGFFGQGTDRDQRTVVYTLDDSKEYYVAVDVLDGKGSHLTIPNEFDGKPVLGMDCKIFENQELKHIAFECSSDIEFINLQSLTSANADLVIEVEKENIDILRNKLYALAYENSEMLSVANNVIPSNLNDGEVYLTFAYSVDSLKEADGSIIPTWFGKENETFDITSHAHSVRYVTHSDVDSTTDLYWCQQNQGSKIYRQYIRDTKQILENSAIKNSACVEVVFDQIYQLNFGLDNDELYEIAESEKRITTVDGEKNYKLSTADRLPKVLESFTARPGFDLKWGLGNDKALINDLNKTIAEAKAIGLTSLNLHPVWDLRAPTILSMTANGVAEKPSAIYGENVAVSSNANAPHETISIRYEWKRNGNTICNTPEFQIDNIHPEDAGAYTLLVTAYSDKTSLTKVEEKILDIAFEKKSISLDWQLNGDNIYNATNKEINIAFENVINDDIIDYKLSQEEIKNAKKYSIDIELVGDADSKYKISSDSKTINFTILPCTVDAVWSNVNSLIYNGEMQAPNVVISGVGDDPDVLFKMSGQAINAGSHKASIVSENTNYVISDATKSRDYTISKRSIDSIVWGETMFTYNASEQYAEVVDAGNIISKDRSTVLNSIIYSNKNVNAGTYKTIVSLPENSNYFFNCSTSMNYTIYRKDLVVKVNDKQATYSGKPITDFSVSVTGRVSKDKDSDIFTVNYYGNATTAINASASPYTINVNLTPGSKYNNYNITVENGNLYINPKTLTIKVDNQEKTYDGQPYNSSLFSFSHTGLCSTDTLGSVVSVKYTGNAFGSVKAGQYTIDANLTYGSKSSNYDIKVVAGTLNIRKAPLTITAKGGTKVYDGKAGGQFDFDISGLVGTDKKSSFTPTYSGAATTNKNAGTHALTVSCAENDVTKNYNIKYTAGTFTITPKQITITAVAKDRAYNKDTVGGVFDFKITGLVAGDSASSFGTPIYSGTATTAVKVGSYTLNVKFADNSVTKNYSITYVADTFNIY